METARLGELAMDLFVVPTISFRLLYGFLIVGTADDKFCGLASQLNDPGRRCAELLLASLQHTLVQGLSLFEFTLISVGKIPTEFFEIRRLLVVGFIHFSSNGPTGELTSSVRFCFRASKNASSFLFPYDFSRRYHCRRHRLLANKGFAAVIEYPDLRAGLNVDRGLLTRKAVAESLGLSFSPVEDCVVA
jgi:hypothetical protein